MKIDTIEIYVPGDESAGIRDELVVLRAEKGAYLIDTEVFAREDAESAILEWENRLAEVFSDILDNPEVEIFLKEKGQEWKKCVFLTMSRPGYETLSVYVFSYEDALTLIRHYAQSGFTIVARFLADGKENGHYTNEKNYPTAFLAGAVWGFFMDEKNQ